jgi:excisionase family DNA binding protein
MSTSTFVGALVKRGFTLDEAALVYGVSKRRLQEAIDDNKLIAHYNGTRPMLHIDELDEWFLSMPTERA